MATHTRMWQATVKHRAAMTRARSARALSGWGYGTAGTDTYLPLCEKPGACLRMLGRATVGGLRGVTWPVWVACRVRPCAEMPASQFAMQDTVQCSSAGCTATATFTGWLGAGATVSHALLTTLVRHIDAAGASNFVSVRACFRWRRVPKSSTAHWCCMGVWRLAWWCAHGLTGDQGRRDPSRGRVPQRRVHCRGVRAGELEHVRVWRRRHLSRW